MSQLDRNNLVKDRATALDVPYKDIGGGDTWLFLRDAAAKTPGGLVVLGDSVTPGDSAAVVVSLEEFERLKALDV